MSNLVRLSSISFEMTKYHFPGAKDKVDLVGLLFSILLDDEFAASPPRRATRSISSDFYSRFCSTDELAATYEFAAAPPQRARTDRVMPSQIMVDWCLCWVMRTRGHDRLIKINKM